MTEADLHNELVAEFFDRVRREYRDDPYGLLLLASSLVAGIAYDLSRNRANADFLIDLIGDEAGLRLTGLPSKVVN